jgi:hypothetical protein
MAKRVIAFLLWGFTAWYAMAYVVEFTGGPALVAPVVGLTVGALIAVDPRHLIWNRREHTAPVMAEPQGDPLSERQGAAPVPTP